MGVLGDFLGGGQARRAWLTDQEEKLGELLRYYGGPASQNGLGTFLAEMSPIESVDRSMTAGREMTSPDRTPMQRVESLGDMLTGVAEVAAPMAGVRMAGTTADDAARALQEALTGVSATPQAVAGREFVADQAGALPIRHPLMKDIARQSHSPKVAARQGRDAGLDITQNDVRSIRATQAARLDRSTDPLIEAKRSRIARTPSAVAQREAERAARLAEIEGQISARAIEKANETAKRSNLVAAARKAREMGLDVRSSKDQSGRISSYYIKTDGGDVRISDHELPWSPRRDFMAQEHGASGFSGFHGKELIVDHNTTPDEIAALLAPPSPAQEMGPIYLTSHTVSY